METTTLAATTTVVADVALVAAIQVAAKGLVGPSNALPLFSDMTTDEVWNTYSHEVLTYFKVRLHGDQQLAEDLRQEVFVRVHQHLPSLNEADKWQHWLHVVMRNVLNDHWKSQYRLKERDSEVIPSTSEEDDSTSKLIAETCVSNMIETLSEKYAEPLRLSDLEGVPQREIADRLGISWSGAKSRVQRGRQLLKDAILGCCRIELNHRNELVDAACSNPECVVCNTP